MEYVQPQLDPQDKDALKIIKKRGLMLNSGTISIQSESHPIEFRKVEIQILEN